jgi:general secretion pathway protein L
MLTAQIASRLVCAMPSAASLGLARQRSGADVRRPHEFGTKMVGAFFHWWIGQLGDLLPGWLGTPASIKVDALILSPLGLPGQPDAIAVSLRREGSVRPLGRFAASAAALRDVPQAPRRPIVLKLAKAEVLEKTLVLPLAAQPDLEQVVTFEMDRETPFEPDEVYWNHMVEAVDRQHQQLRVRLVLVPKCRLEPLLGALTEAGIAPRWVEISDAGAADVILPLNGDRKAPLNRSRRLLWPAAGCCALLALGAVATPFVRQSLQLSSLDRQLRAARVAAHRATVLTDEVERLTRAADLIRGEEQKAGRPLEVLADITRLFPDDTYLTEFDMHQRTVTLNGRSARAARLIGLLATDGAFRNPAFAAPVTRLEALHAEVFTINADVAPQK